MCSCAQLRRSSGFAAAVAANVGKLFAKVAHTSCCQTLVLFMLCWAAQS
jgi:hypothetical protein